MLTLSEDLDLYSPQALVFDEANRGYLLDYSNCDLVVFSPEGTLIRRFGQKGEGPGEFKRPFDLSYWNGLLYVYDIGLKRISCFKTDGTFLWQRLIARTCTSAVAAQDRLYLAYHHHAGLPDIEVYPLAEKGDALIQITLKHADARTYHSFLSVDEDGLIYASPINHYVTEVYAADGTAKGVIRRPFEVPAYRDFPPLKLAISVAPQTRSVVSKDYLAILSGGHQKIYQQLAGSSLGAEYNTGLDFFSKSGTFLFRAWGEDMGIHMEDVHSYPILAMDRRGRIWLSALDDETRVTCYQLIPPK